MPAPGRGAHGPHGAIWGPPRAPFLWGSWEQLEQHEGNDYQGQDKRKVWALKGDADQVEQEGHSGPFSGDAFMLCELPGYSFARHRSLSAGLCTHIQTLAECQFWVYLRTTNQPDRFDAWKASD